MIYLLETVHILVCVFLILVVLLQQGKGADLSVFGGGSTQTAFGARTATTLLHKLTVASFVIFIVTTVGIALAKGTVSTVMSGAPVKKATATKTLPAKPAPVPVAPAPAAPAPVPASTPKK
ncbi:MAG TPA: preprotein translocase subunit SecG [Thermoanaerobaculia bacterium]|nr:preprotein translocase subunit SecG [Thermoanaerobaculia bacterium]